MISDLKKNDIVNHKFLLKSYTLEQSKKSANKYGAIILGDKTGSIDARYWEANENHIENTPLGSIVKVTGVVDEWEGKTQIIINTMEISSTEENLLDYLLRPDIHPEELYASIMEYAAKIKRDKVRELVCAVLEQVKEKFIYYPASYKNHHAYYAGLILHTHNMLKLADPILVMRPFLDSDLVYAGIILHDLGKSTEFDYSPWVPASYSKHGSLVGHVGIGITLLAEQATRLGIPNDDPDFIALSHILISHHGRYEWGSPILPRTPEAVMVHMIDSMDATMTAIEDLVAELNEDSYEVPLVGVLDRRKLYVSDHNKQNVKHCRIIV